MHAVSEGGGGGRSVPGGAAAAGKVSRWGVGGSRCAGPARSPALAVSLRAPEAAGGRYRVVGPGGGPAIPLPPQPAVCPHPGSLPALCPAPSHHPPLLPGPDPPCPGAHPLSGARPAGTEGLCGACRGRGAAGLGARGPPAESPWGQPGLSGTRGERAAVRAA